MDRSPAESTSPVTVIISRGGMRVQFRYVGVKPILVGSGMFSRLALISTSIRYFWPRLTPQSYHAGRLFRSSPPITLRSVRHVRRDTGKHADRPENSPGQFLCVGKVTIAVTGTTARRLELARRWASAWPAKSVFNKVGYKRPYTYGWIRDPCQGWCGFHIIILPQPRMVKIR